MNKNKELSDYLSNKVGLAIEDSYNVSKELSNTYQAILIGDCINKILLNKKIIEGIDYIALTKTFNDLCDDYPKVEKKVRKKF